MVCLVVVVIESFLGEDDGLLNGVVELFIVVCIGQCGVDVVHGWDDIGNVGHPTAKVLHRVFEVLFIGVQWGIQGENGSGCNLDTCVQREIKRISK